MPPKISVIIPTFNRASMVVETIDSVLNQTYKDFEIIVVDDGSTDDTTETLRPYFDRIKYLKQSNQGHAAARNAGFKVALGELIAQGDSDDLWFPEKLEKQVKYLNEHPDVDMVCGNGIFFGDPKVEGKKVIPDKRAIPLEREGVSLRSIFMKSSIRTPTIIAKRHVFKGVGGFDPNFKICVDLDFAFRVLMKYKVVFMNEPLFKLRRHEGHLGGDSERRTLFNIKAIEKLLREYPEARALIGQDNINRRLAYRYYRLGRIYRKKKRRSDALVAFKKALSYRPFYPSCLLHYGLCLIKKG